MYYKTDTGQKFLDHSAIRAGMTNPLVMFPDVITEQMLEHYHIHQLTLVAKPSCGPTEVVVEESPQFINGTWTQVWAVREGTPEELEVAAAEIAAAKQARNQLINGWRETANFTTFPFNGKLIACDSLSRSDIDAVAGHINLLGTFPEDFPGAWRYTDNTYVALPNVDAFKLMYSAMTKQGTANFNHSQVLKASLAAATTLEQVEAVVW